MQQRSMPHFQKGNEIVRSGQLGKIHKVHLTWNRNTPRATRPPNRVDPATVDWKTFLRRRAPNQPFDDYRFRQWRWFWDFGGGMFTDLMVHCIDVAHWYPGSGSPGEAAEHRRLVHGQGRLGDARHRADAAALPGREVQVYFEGTFSNARNGAMMEFMGTEGTLYIDRGRYEMHPERKRPAESRRPLPPSFAYSEWVIGKGPRGADFYDEPNGELLHLANWIECVRSRKQPAAPVEAGVRAASSAHLANRALRSGQVAKWEGPAI